jgi:hypothetical protein
MNPRPFRARTGRSIRSARALPALGVCLALAACGSSTASSPSTNTTATGTSASSKGAQAPGASRFTALRSCLAKQGITLPTSTGTRPGFGAGGPAGRRGHAGRFKLPAGVTRTQFQEALQKCGGANFGGGGRFNSPASRAALAKYVACMRENGVKLPTPNTTGGGPVFNTNGINTTSSVFKSATTKCLNDLPRRRPGNPSSSQ